VAEIKFKLVITNIDRDVKSLKFSILLIRMKLDKNSFAGPIKTKLRQAL
jgi:hypothetical protein